MSRTTKSRVVAGITAIALAAGTSLMLAPSASAAPPEELAGTSIASSSAHPTIFINANGQAAGDFTLAALPAMPNTDFITIEVDDSDVAANCAAAGDSVAFSSVPTVTTSTGAAVALTPTISNTGSCALGTNNSLKLTATAAIPAGTLVKISGIKYSVGIAAAVGAVQHKIAGGAFSVTDTNAFISAVTAGSAAPATLIAPSTANQAVGDIVLTELRPSAIPVGACVTIGGPVGMTFHAAPVPTVTKTTGNGTPSTAVVVGPALGFTVTPAGVPTATTYVISGIRVDSGAARGPIDAVVGTACGTSDISQQVRIGFVGTVDRTAGSSRYATAAQIAASQYGDLAGKTVVIARGDNYPDALAASYLAGKNGVPILLTPPASLAAETTAALKFHGVTNVVLIGGTAAITDGVQQAIDALPTYNFGSNTANAATIAVTRIGGEDRYATARNVAEFVGAPAVGTTDPGLDASCTTPVRTAILASGENFPDAIAAGGLAYGGLKGPGACGSGGLPMLLTAKASLSPSAAAALNNLGIKQVIIVGGTEAVSAATATAAAAVGSGVNVVRIAGADRQGTAVALATGVLGATDKGEWNTGGFLVTRPDNFPDALTASSLSGNFESPIYLAASTTALGTTTAQGIVDYPTQYTAGQLIGGTDALSAAVATQTGTAIANQPSA